VNRERRIIVQASVFEIEPNSVVIVERDGIYMAIETTGANRFAPGDRLKQPVGPFD